MHQTTVDSYLESVIAQSIDNTAANQAREEIEIIAAQLNAVAYDIEDK